MATLTRFKVGKNTYELEYVQDWSHNFNDLVNVSDSLPGMHGSYDQYGSGEAPAADGVVRVSFVVAVQDTALMTAKLDALNAMARDKKGYLFSQPDDPTASERWCVARLDNLSEPNKVNDHTDYWMRATATFAVNDPHWYTTGTGAAIWGQFKWGQQIWGGEAPKHTFSGTQTDLTIAVSEGNAPAQANITVSIGAGETAENVTLQRIVDGLVVEEVKFTDTLVEGDSLKIKVNAKSVKKNAVAAYANFEAKNNRWLRLLPGSNTIRVLCENEGDAGTVSITYRGTFT